MGMLDLETKAEFSENEKFKSIDQLHLQHWGV
jgi:hypothetical protein